MPPNVCPVVTRWTLGAFEVFPPEVLRSLLDVDGFDGSSADYLRRLVYLRRHPDACRPSSEHMVVVVLYLYCGADWHRFHTLEESCLCLYESSAETPGGCW